MKRKRFSAGIPLLCALTALLCASSALLLLIWSNQGDSTQTEPEISYSLETSSQRPESVPQTTPTETVPDEPADPIEEMVNALSTEQKVGQLFLVRCPESGAEEAIRNYAFGGILLFGRDFDGESKDSMELKTASYQSAAEIPLLIAVDEEGGTVTRVSSHTAFCSSRFSSPRELYNRGGMELVLSEESQKAQLLQSLGINVNLAPVCDISTQPGAFMYQRSLGQSAEITGQFVAGAIKTMQSYGVAAVMKHFPGYGNNADTHVGTARDERSLSELEANDMQPFFDGIAAGGNAVMVSHNIVDALDSSAPASLSYPVHHYLRMAMGFDGVIMTDDLSMEAITQQYGAGEAAVLAVLAGNDILCVSDYEMQYAAVLSACSSNRISEETLNQAVYHVLKWKVQMGLINP